MKAKSFIVQLIQDTDPMNPREMSDTSSHMVTNHRNYTFGGAANDEENSSIGVAFESLCYCPAHCYIAWVFSEFIEPSPEGSKGAFSGWYLDSTGTFCLESSEGLIEMGDKVMLNMVDAVEAWADTNLAILPLHLYDHSGITMNTSGFSCQWDSGQIGYIYITKDEYENQTEKPFTQESAQALLVSEVEEYDQYLTGDVWGIIYSELTDQEDIDQVAEDYEQVAGNNLMRCYLIADNPDGYLYSVSREEIDSCWGYYGHRYAEALAKEDAEDICTAHFLEGDFSEYKITEWIDTHDGITKRKMPNSLWLSPQKAINHLKSLPSVDDVEVAGVITL